METLCPEMQHIVSEFATKYPEDDKLGKTIWILLHALDAQFVAMRTRLENLEAASAAPTSIPAEGPQQLIVQDLVSDPQLSGVSPQRRVPHKRKKQESPLKSRS
ncbi:hypothetical protein AVEN_71993-1 [Araneus ventricosus]|uniref:Uncharacterized protein n=1 Tax=Araneus ventricosus TaxID=182803 RepID=A0A4Y2DD53_ARAVE|nr:hypothetical protein AVEN_71993-1 [Araneus ventricosus]